MGGGEYWAERWREGRIGFHEGRPNRWLEQHLSRLGARRRVLVPLCGKAEDMALLASRGHQVVGVELVEDAARAFFAEHGLTPEQSAAGPFRVLEAGGVRILVGDFLATTPELLDGVDALYDRAALIALPLDLRKRYARHARSLLPAGAPGLLVTIEYPQALWEGPPFAVLPDEVRKLYGDLEMAELGEGPADAPTLRAAGVHAAERCWLIHFRPGTDVLRYNRDAWDREVARANRWTVPATPEAVAAARRGEWEVVLTPQKPVPRAWFPDLAGADVLCLASGGGQQAPIFAAAGARVTLLDASPAQLGQDRSVAEREGLAIRTELGDMADLSRFADESFDLVFHPCSNCFVPDVRPVWREAARVLRPGGTLLAGFGDPLVFSIDDAPAARTAEPGTPRRVELRHAIPYSDLTSLSDAERARYTDNGEPLCFGHTLEHQIGGQLEAGLVLVGFYDDLHVAGEPLNDLLPGFHATRALKPRG
jgi:thiopurine S-methyltransferase (Se/Te detoxification family)